MEKMRLSLAWILTLLVISIRLSASPAPSSGNHPVLASSRLALQKQLNAFFSEVAVADFAPFHGRPSDKEMIGFALVHILLKQPELLQRETGVSGFVRVPPKRVEQVAEAFFGQRIRQNKTVSAQFRYVGGSYLVSTEEWEEMLFAQITRLGTSERGRFTADIAIYSVPASFSGDINAPPATWNNQPHRPTLEKRMRGTVQAVHDGDKTHYILIAYEKRLPG